MGPECNLILLTCNWQSAIGKQFTDTRKRLEITQGNVNNMKPFNLHQQIMKKKARRFSSLLFTVDFLLLGLSFFLLNYFKRGTFALPASYDKLLLAFYGFWILISLLTRKFYHRSYRNYLSGLLLIGKSNAFLIYAVSFMVVFLHLKFFSRGHIFGTTLLFAGLEAGLFSLYYYFGGKKIILSLNGILKPPEIKRRFSVFLLITDFIFITSAFFVLNYFKRNSLQLNPEYDKLLLVIYALWLITGLFTRKFEIKRYRNFYYSFSPYVKSVLLMAATMSLLVFAFRLFFYSRLQVFGTFLLLFIFEAVFKFFYFTFLQSEEKTGDVETVEEVQDALKQEVLEFDRDNGKNHRGETVKPVQQKLQDRYLNLYPQLFNFINNVVNLKEIDDSETVVLSTHTPYNIETIEDNSLDLFINLQRLNDFRFINRYFLEVHRKFFNGGYFVGRADTIDTYKSLFYKKYPRYFADILYILDFVFVRIFPKLPGIKKLYFFLTGGKNRVISKAELLGRLYFCGFEVLAVKEIGDSLYFIAQKVKTPSFDSNPSYSPVIRLKRIGYNGNTVEIYKFRTMHPYSEYLQDYIYRLNKLQDNGKFQDDFRLTEWGKVFRQLWIDELPQLVNFMRGDVNLVGVRALSQHYFTLYPPDVQKLRTQFKPGLVPPYYADLPRSLEGIIESEKRYLLQKQESPLITDIKYFSKAFYNIIFKHARSR